MEGGLVGAVIGYWNCGQEEDIWTEIASLAVGNAALVVLIVHADEVGAYVEGPVSGPMLDLEVSAYQPLVFLVLENALRATKSASVVGWAEVAFG